MLDDERRPTCGCDLAVSPDGRTVATGLDGPGLYALDGRELLADALDAPGLADADGFSVIGRQRRRPPALGRPRTAPAPPCSSATATAGAPCAPTPSVLGTMQPDGRLLQVDPGTRHRHDRRSGHRCDRAPLPRPGQTTSQSSSASAATAASRPTAASTGRSPWSTPTRGDRRRPPRRPPASSTPATSSRPPPSCRRPFQQRRPLARRRGLERRRRRLGHHHLARAAVLEPAIADVNGAVTPAFDPDRAATSPSAAAAPASTCSTPPPCGRYGRSPSACRACPTRPRSIPAGRRLVVVLDTAQACSPTTSTTGRRRSGPRCPPTCRAGIVFVDADHAGHRRPGDAAAAALAPRPRRASRPRRAGRPAATSPATSGPASARPDEPYRLTCPQFGEPPDDPTLSVEQAPATIEVPTP